MDNDYDGTVDGLYAPEGVAKVAQILLGARSFHTAWSLGSLKNYSCEFNFFNSFICLNS